ncbi:hypothetical protein DFJ74DRAFT_666404 [Hyaloraphidium curvatum]|nr:hypothetical protein DFJ74DRAFT_666404 [Hyaloraphidium curvatum]
MDEEARTIALPILASALAGRPPLTAPQLARAAAGLDFATARDCAAQTEWPGGEVQKFLWVKGWVEANGVAKKGAECREMGGGIRLERISLDDLETVVEVGCRKRPHRVVVADPARGGSPRGSSRSARSSGSTRSWPAACAPRRPCRCPSRPRSRSSRPRPPRRSRPRPPRSRSSRPPPRRRRPRPPAARRSARSGKRRRSRQGRRGSSRSCRRRRRRWRGGRGSSRRGGRRRRARRACRP